jgi:hypothetical protein
MKTSKYYAAYAVIDGAYDLTLCTDRTQAEIILNQHKMSSQEIVGITNRPATRHQLVKTLRDARPGCTIHVRTA